MSPIGWLAAVRRRYSATYGATSRHHWYTNQPLTTTLRPRTASTSMARAASRRSGRASGCPCVAGRIGNPAGTLVNGWVATGTGTGGGPGAASGTLRRAGGGGPGGGVASNGSGSPIQPSPSQYRWVVGSAGSLYQPGSILMGQ